MKITLDNDRILNRMREQQRRLTKPADRMRAAEIDEEDERRLSDLLVELATELLNALPWWARLGFRLSGQDVEELLARALRWIEQVIVDIIQKQRKQNG